jgi:hypothetical protein
MHARTVETYCNVMRKQIKYIQNTGLQMWFVMGKHNKIITNWTCIEKSRTKFVNCLLTLSTDKLPSNPLLYIIALKGEIWAIQQWQLLDHHCFQLYSTWRCSDWTAVYIPHWMSGIIFCTLVWTDSNYVPTYEGNSKINLQLVGKKKRIVIVPKRKLSSNK